MSKIYTATTSQLPPPPYDYTQPPAPCNDAQRHASYNYTQTSTPYDYTYQTTPSSHVHSSISYGDAQRPTPYSHAQSSTSYDNKQPSTHAGLTQEDAEEVSASLQWIHSTPSHSNRQPLSRLVAIPQIEPTTLISGPMPFLRAYAPALATHNITVEHFTAFIDGLTIAQAPSPPLQAVQLVGTGMGFVPHHWAQLASAGVGLAAGAGTAAVAATRTKLYLKETNARFFAPRGLRVRIASDEDLQQQLRVPVTIPLLAPADARNGCLSLSDCRLAALWQYLSPLTLDVPPPVAPKNVIDKLSAKQVQAKLRKNREKAEKESLKREEGGERGKGKGKGKKGGKRERERAEKEVKGVRKFKWIVVESL